MSRLPARQPRKDLEFKGFFAAADREALIEACEASDDQRLRDWVTLRRDPKLAHYLDATLAQKAAVTLKCISEAYLDYARAKGYVEISRRLPQAMADVADDALSQRMLCATCFGKKVVPVGCLRCHHSAENHIGGEACCSEACKCNLFQEPPVTEIDCPSCWGQGFVVKSGDPEARKALLDAAKVSGKGGPLVAQQFNFDGAFSVEGMISQGEKLMGGK